MNIKLLDRNNNAAIILAGILALVVGVGVSRFAFTSLLPSMLDDFLSVTFAGVLASTNYVGYLSGAIFAVFIKNINAKVKYFRLGMFLCVFTTLFLSISINEVVWLLSRIIAGFGAAMALVVGSAIVMTKLKLESKTKAMGIHFSGIGFSILICDLLMRFVFINDGTWEDSWMLLTIFALIASIYSVYILSFDKEVNTSSVHNKFDKSIFSFYVILLTLAYFAVGIGFVVFATFLPDIINSLDGLFGYGSLTWTLVGLAGIPSCIIWMNLAHKYGSVNIIIIAMFLLFVGIMIPTFTSNIYLNLLSGVLYGGTFVGLVGLFLNVGGKLAGSNPVVLMGALTTSYGVGQVLGPLYSIALFEYFKDYTYALYVTAAIVFMGIILLLLAKNIANDEQKKL